MTLSLYEIHEKLSEMLSLQRELNHLVNPQWAHENYNWGRYITLELGEAHDHLGYKHWKKHSNNFGQFELEIIDVFHFYLSIVASRPLDEANQEITNLAKLLYLNRYNRGSLNHYILNGDINDKENLQNILDAGMCLGIVEKTSKGSFNQSTMADLLIHGLVYEEEGLIAKLRALYVPKNCLNIYRNKNGYMTGKYQKVINDREDNEYLEDIMKESPDADAETILKILAVKIPQGA